MNPNNLNIAMIILDRYMDLYDSIISGVSAYNIFKDEEQVEELRIKSKRNFSVMMLFCNKGYNLNKKSTAKNKLTDIEVMESLIDIHRDIDGEIKMLERDLRDMNNYLTESQYNSLRKELRQRITDLKIEDSVIKELIQEVNSHKN